LGKKYGKRSQPRYLRVKVRSTPHRKGYSYRRKDVGLPGRGPVRIPVAKGTLSKHGYSIKLPAEKRRDALRKAIDEFGALAVYRKLKVMVIMRKRTQPKAREIFEADASWVREQYKMDGFVS